MADLKINIIVDDAGAVQRINQVEAALGGLGASASKTAQGVNDSVIAGPRAIGKALDEISTSVGAHIANNGRLLSSFGSSLAMTVTAPLVAVGGAAIKASMDFETAFSGISKTVDGVASKGGKLTAFGEELKQSFRDLATSIPITVNELAAIGETAGAMGIPKEKLLDFTSVVAKLGATTNLSSQAAATALGHIQNAYGRAGEDTDRFASALVDLGNKGASTEAQIVRFAERMAASGAQIGITQAQLLGWANAMASIGIRAEMGSTAWMRTLNAMSIAVDQMSPKLDLFAKVAGMSSQGFANLFKQDASEALMRFIEGLNRIKESGGNVSQVLEDLKLKSVGFNITLKGLANAHDMVRESLVTGTKAWKDNAAMEEEFGKKAATTASQLKVLYNHVYDVAIELGNELIPHLKETGPAFENVLSGLMGAVKWFGDLPSGIQTAVIAGAGFLALLGPMAGAIGKIVTTGGQMLELMGKFGMWEKLGQTFELASGSMGRFGQASLVAGAALAGWELGRLIAQMFDLDTKIANTMSRILGFGDIAGETSGAKGDSIKLALQRGANTSQLGSTPDEQYRNAIKFNAEWNANRLKAPRVDTDAAMNGAVVTVPGFGPGSATKPKPPKPPQKPNGPAGDDDGGDDGGGGGKGPGSRRARTDTELRDFMKSVEADIQRVDDYVANTPMFQKITDPMDMPTATSGLHGSTLPGQQMQRPTIPAKPPEGLIWGQLYDSSQADVTASAQLLGSRFSQTLKHTITTSFGTSSAQFGQDLGNVILGSMTSGGNAFESVGRFVTAKISSGIKQSFTTVKSMFLNEVVDLAAVNTRAALDKAPKLVQNIASTIFSAIGSGQNPFTAVGTKLGSDFGSDIAKSLGSHLSGNLGKVLGGSLNSLLPGIGALLGPLLGKLGSVVTGFFKNMFGNQTKDLINESFGSYAQLRDLLNPLGAEGDQMWVKLTQQTGKGDVTSTRAQIEAITAALEAHKQKLNETTAAAQQTGAAESAAFTEASNALTELDNQIKGLKQSIANEAPEEVMGVIEEQTRAKIKLLEEQRAEITVNVHWNADPLPVPGGGTATFEVPEDATPMASGGIVRARPGGTLVRVGEAGRDEMITPLGGSGAGGGVAVIQIDGRTVAEVVVPHIPGVVKRYKVGTL